MKDHPYDQRFGNAVHSAAAGNSEPLAAILRSNSLPLANGGREPLVIGPGERELLASLAERCAELARGDRGGEIGRREIAAGHPSVREAIERFNGHLAKGMRRSAAKSLTCEEMGIASIRTPDRYLKLTKEREEAVRRAIK